MTSTECIVYDTFNSASRSGTKILSSGAIVPTVAREGQFRFVVNTRENDFEPPHVHVWVGGEDVCRIELNSGRFMDEPPPGEYRNILQAYLRHVDAIRRTWDEIHHR